MEVINTTTDQFFFDWETVDREVGKAKHSADCDADSSAATSVGDSWSRQVSDTSSFSKSPPLGYHKAEGVSFDGLDSSTTGPSTPDDTDSDSEDTPSGGASMISPLGCIEEENEFLDLDDILAIDVPKHEATEYSTIELEANLAIEDMFNSAMDGTAFAHEIVQSDTSASHVAVAQQDAAKGGASETGTRKDRAAQLQAKWDQMEKRQRDHPPPKKAFDSNKQKLLELADDLNEAFSEDAFQWHLHIILRQAREEKKLPPDALVGFVQGRQDLVRAVHTKILPTYGYGSCGHALGYYSMLLDMEPYCFDRDVVGRLATTDTLLSLPANSSIYEVLDTAEKFLPDIAERAL